MEYHSYLRQPGISISAHRGGSLEAPENTLEAFKYSLDIGCKYIETDVQLSSDGIPYIFHDDDLKRILDQEIAFNSMPSSEIDRLIIFQKYTIPTLEAALLRFPEALFQIDGLVGCGSKTTILNKSAIQIRHFILRCARYQIVVFKSFFFEK